MIKETLIAINILANVGLSSLGGVTPSTSASVMRQEKVLAQREMDLTKRLPNSFGSQVFADNILLSLHYLKGDVEKLRVSENKVIYGPDDIDWNKVRDSFEVNFTLKPGEIYAFHNVLLPEFKEAKYTMNSKFYTQEGYKSLAGLGGNGVCHIASLINWVAKDAGLETVAHVNHDFYPVPGVPREYGVSIFSTSADQNLYIRNNFEEPIEFRFKADNKKVVLEITK